MARYHYCQADLCQAIRDSGVKAGDVVFSHSNIGYFGIPQEGRDVNTALEVIQNAFLEVLGAEGTLIVPTFTYSFPQGKVFDPDNTPSDCGIFTETIRRRPDAIRSEDPCVSVAAIGARAAEMTRDVPENAYGPGSFFDRFYHAEGVICNLNFDAGSTFVHYAERTLQVPYRFDKTFEGVIRRKEKDQTHSCTIYVRDISSDDTIAFFEAFDQLARSSGFYVRNKVGRGFVGAISSANTMKLIRETLPSRPRFLTRAEATQ